MTKEDVINYVMNTPGNTNRQVLSGMLDAISGTQLPSPTESDNGKVLGVDGGEYKLVDGGAEAEKIRITDGVWFWKDGNTGHLVFDTFALNASTMNQYLFRASDYWGEISEYPVDIRPAILENGKFQSAVLVGFSGSAYGVSIETLNMSPETVVVIQKTGTLLSDPDALTGEITYLLLNA